jgi:hypothetical protein
MMEVTEISKYDYLITYHLSGVIMVSMLSPNVVDRWLNTRSDQIKLIKLVSVASPLHTEE